MATPKKPAPPVQIPLQRMTAEERDAAHNRIVRLTKEKVRIESDKKDANDEFKNQLSACDEEIWALIRRLDEDEAARQ